MRPTLLVVHAHPDDESITTGGILARYSRQGVRTIVATCTTGGAGVNGSLHGNAKSLARARAGELRAAASILGVSRVVLLGYRDSGMRGIPAMVTHVRSSVRTPPRLRGSWRGSWTRSAPT